jgi:hypothetical protein
MILIVTCLSTDATPSLTRSVKVYEPGVVATPLNAALAFAGNHGGPSGRTIMPGGGVPPAIDHA